jgi:hypothetical protein
MMKNGPRIFINREACRNMGRAACNFMRKHERAHVVLGHLQNGAPARQAEREADCWAARRASPQELAAAIKDFQAVGSARDPVHGSGYERARRVQACAGRSAERR